MATILTVDDEPGIRAFVADALAEGGHDIREAPDGASALDLLAERPYDLLILDLRMPGALDGMEVLRRVRAEWPRTQVVVLTACGSVGAAVEAMRLGAFDFLEKPLEGPEGLRRLVGRALNWQATVGGRRVAEDEPPHGHAPRAAAPVREESRVRRLLRELRRRHVYNMVATYAAVVFVALQAAQLVLPALPFPSWTYSALVALAIAGFPAALVLGWIFDVTVTPPAPAGPGRVGTWS